MEKKDKGKTGDLKDWLSRRQKKKEGSKEEIHAEDKQTLTDLDDEEKDEHADAPTKLPEAAIEEKAEQDKTVKLPKAEQEQRQDSIWPPRESPVKNIKLPLNVYAHFLLIDIDGPAKLKGIPRFFPIESTRTLIGRYAKAPIRLDDQKTVRTKHASLSLEELSEGRGFVLYPIEDCAVVVNNKRISHKGVTLENGDRVHIGSAKLIFFYKDMGEDRS